MPAVTIETEGGPVVVECHAGQTLFEAGAKVSAGIDTACVGKGRAGCVA
jgi:hypothetical protein